MRTRSKDSKRRVPAGRELLDQLRNVEGLSPASRAVLVLHFEEGLTLSEIAAILELPLGTVKSRLAYGLSALRRRIDVKGGQYD